MWSDIASAPIRRQPGTVKPLESDTVVRQVQTNTPPAPAAWKRSPGKPAARQAASFPTVAVGASARGLEALENSLRVRCFPSQVKNMSYRTLENVIDGVVIAFNDIGRVKRPETELGALSGKARE